MRRGQPRVAWASTGLLASVALVAVQLGGLLALLILILVVGTIASSFGQPGRRADAARDLTGDVL